MPAPAIAAAFLRGAQAARAAGAALGEERALARKAKAARAALKAKSDIKSKAESAQRLAQKLKQIKRIGWLIKGVTLATSSIGDVFISIWVLLFWANMELIIFPLIMPWWKQAWWEKLFTILLDFIVLSILLITIGILAYFVNDPDAACVAFGVATANMFLASFGLVGGCEIVKDVATWVAQ